jgi:hypothetical protein
MSQSRVRPPSIVTPRRAVISVVLAACVVMFAWAFSQSRTTPRVTYRDAAIVAVYPDVGDLDLRQTRIGVQINPAWTGVLQVDGHEIPDDQVERVVGLNQIFYTPGPGKETGALAPGQHCATAVVWRITETRDQSHPYTWCFNVH